jgi:tRNA(Ile)-lysidine synthase
MLREAVRHFFVKHGLAACRVTVAVSGGADSTALLLALAQEGLEVTAAHVNHHLRGSDSDEDERFVRALCERLGIALDVADGTLDPAAVRARGVEAAAREVRYAKLLAMRDAAGAHYLATAHQKNDQAETVLMRLLTGSGIEALQGIRPVRDDRIIRPLLDVTRTEVDAFLIAEGITPRHDRSNDDPRFLRNRVRLLVRELGATEHLASVLANISDQARAQWQILERAIDEAERLCIVTADAIRFASVPEPWLAQALLHRHIRRLDPDARDVGAKDLERLARQLREVTRVSVTKHLELVGDTLQRLPEVAKPFEVPLTPDEPARLDDLTVHVGSRPGAQRIQLPDGAEPRFVVRSRRPGDRFQPLGMRNSKKLKDFLIDRKIAAGARDRLPLLVWNGEIVWVAGVEVSERFKVTDPPGGSIYQVWLEESAGTSGGARAGDHSPLHGRGDREPRPRARRRDPD